MLNQQQHNKDNNEYHNVYPNNNFYSHFLSIVPIRIPRVSSSRHKKSPILYEPQIDYEENNEIFDNWNEKLQPNYNHLRSLNSSANSIKSAQAAAFKVYFGVPMKKVIRKSRFVSIHDGHPVSFF